MNVATEKSVEALVWKLLLDAGIKRTDWAYCYLSQAVLLVADGSVELGTPLWKLLAERHQKRTANVRGACLLGIKRAYYRDPERFCAALEHVYFQPPRTRDFIAETVMRVKEESCRVRNSAEAETAPFAQVN